MRIFTLALLFVLVSIGSIAQPGGGGPGGGGNPDAVPLGGIELLIAAGALLGAKKAFDKRKSK